MYDIFQDVFLSPFLFFIVMIGMMIALTVWAFRLQEYAGYILGWLVAIFVIVVWATVTGGQPSGVEEEAAQIQTEDVRLSLFAVAVPSLLGLLGGFGTLFVMREFSGSRTWRSATIALLTWLLVMTIYFLLSSSALVSRLVGIFALAFAIGALSTVVFFGSPTPRPPERRFNPNERTDYYRTGEIPEARVEDDRFDRLRRPDRRK
jgi:hypothetical protein